jgi:hypothetical protein
LIIQPFINRILRIGPVDNTEGTFRVEDASFGRFSEGRIVSKTFKAITDGPLCEGLSRVPKTLRVASQFFKTLGSR